ARGDHPAVRRAAHHLPGRDPEVRPVAPRHHLCRTGSAAHQARYRGCLGAHARGARHPAAAQAGRGTDVRPVGDRGEMMDLVVQHPRLRDGPVNAFAERLGAPPTRRDATVARWSAAPALPSHELAGLAEAQAVDAALVPRGARLADYRLLAFDMDSTLITIECIDEIADYAGCKPQVAAITEAAMRGEIRDYDESLRRRAALLAGLDVAVLDRVYAERLRLSPGARDLIEAARHAGLKTLLVSGGF